MLQNSHFYCFPSSEWTQKILDFKVFWRLKIIKFEKKRFLGSRLPSNSWFFVFFAISTPVVLRKCSFPVCSKFVFSLLASTLDIKKHENVRKSWKNRTFCIFYTNPFSDCFLKVTKQSFSVRSVANEVAKYSSFDSLRCTRNPLFLWGSPSGMPYELDNSLFHLHLTFLIKSLRQRSFCWNTTHYFISL